MFEKTISGFSSYIRDEKGLRDSSLEAYLSDVSSFAEFMKELSLYSPNEVNSTHVIRYVLSLQRIGRSASTIARHLASIRCMFEYLHMKGIVDEDPTLNLKAPRKERRSPSVLSEKDVISLLELPNDTTEKGARDKAILELMYATGLKVSEIADLDLEDVNLERSILSLENRSVPFGTMAKKSMQHYIDTYRTESSKNEPMFPNSNNKRLTRQGLWKIIKGYTDSVSHVESVTPQTIRNSFAVHMLSHGAELGLVQRLLGHSDSSSTIIFSHLTGREDASDGYKKAHPRA